MNRRTAQFMVAWGLVVVLFLGFLDIKFRDSTQRSDFVTAFYVAGNLVLNKQQTDLYPPEGTRSFENAPFVVRARKILPYMRPGYTVEYMYTPIVACAFVPFSFFPPWVALLLWQVVSLFAVIGSGALVVRPIASTGKLEHNPWLYGLAGLT